MGSRRASRASIASCALVMGMAGCGLISGASDLTVDDAFDGGGGGGGGDPDGGPLGDGAVRPLPDGGSDTSRADGMAIDASIDGTSDAGPRIRAITFEGNSLVGPFGFDTTSGQINIVNGSFALDGTYSARGDKDGFGRVTFPAVNDLYVSMLVRIENIGFSTSTLVAIAAGPAMTTVEVELDKTDGVILSIGNDIIGSGGNPAEGQTYRLGVHVRQGAAGAALAEVFFVPRSVPFGAPLARTTATALGQARSLAAGVVLGNSRVVFDDITLDSASMPTP